MQQDLGAAFGSGTGMPGMVADRYEVRDRIGRGGFGEVYEVYDQRLRRLVALKVMPIGTAGAESEEEMRRFEMEARAVARLSHPGIVTVHDFGQTPDFAWIAMELVIGETLKSVLDQGERPSLAEAIRVTCDLLDALHYAHGRGIVHRDVKPANVMLAVNAEDGLGEVKLTDFGIARTAETQQTMVGQIMGTPSAMSPEQVRGDAVDPRSDLWSVGVILYQLLTGKRPFPGQIPAVFQSILTSEPVPPSQIVAELPPALDRVVAKALAKAASDRYSDAAEMAAALRAAAYIPGPALPMESEQDSTVRLLPALPPPAAAAATTAPSGARRGWAIPLTLGFLAGTLCGAMAMHHASGLDGFAVLTELSRGAAAPEPSHEPAPAALHPEPPPPASPGLSPEPEPVREAMADAQREPVQESMVPPVPEPVPVQETLPSPVPEPVEEPLPVREPVQELVPEAAAEPAQAPAVPNAPAAPDPAPPEPVLTALAPQARPPAPVPEALRSCSPQQLATRAGSHPGFGRVVFDWTVPTRFEFQRTEQGGRLRFPAAGCMPSVERLVLPRNVLSLRTDEEGRSVLITIAAGARLRAYRLEGNRVVLDALDQRE